MQRDGDLEESVIHAKLDGLIDLELPTESSRCRRGQRVARGCVGNRGGDILVHSRAADPIISSGGGSAGNLIAGVPTHEGGSRQVVIETLRRADLETVEVGAHADLIPNGSSREAGGLARSGGSESARRVDAQFDVIASQEDIVARSSVVRARSGRLELDDTEKQRAHAPQKTAESPSGIARRHFLRLGAFHEPVVV